MEKSFYEEFLSTEAKPKHKNKKNIIEIGSKVKIKKEIKITAVYQNGLFGSDDLTGAVVNDYHKFPMSEFTPVDDKEQYLVNNNEYEVLEISKTGNAVKVKMQGREVLIFKKCLEVVE